MHRVVAFTLSLGLGMALLAGRPALADEPGVIGTDVLYLQKDCAAAGHTLNVDCFESVSALTAAIWGGATPPTAADPLVVDIGVGVFTGPLACNGSAAADQGHVTFRGVGRDRSVLENPTTGTLQAAIAVANCHDLEFQDIGVRGHNGFLGLGVTWTGGGSSIWTDVEIDANYSAWLDLPGNCPTEAEPIHYLFGSRIFAGGSYTYLAVCGEHWIYGSELRMEAKSTELPQAVPRRTVAVSGEGDVRVFGGTIRSFPGAGFPRNDDFVGVSLGLQENGGGVFHMHGGIISIDAGSVGRHAIGIESLSATAFAHTPGTAFVVKKGTGSSVRVTGPGTLRSPFLWESGTDAPLGGIVSQTGKDLFVETDCDASGCNGTGTDPHLMIYSSGCGADPWFDVVRGACR